MDVTGCSCPALNCGRRRPAEDNKSGAVTAPPPVPGGARGHSRAGGGTIRALPEHPSAGRLRGPPVIADAPVPVDRSPTDRTGPGRERSWERTNATEPLLIAWGPRPARGCPQVNKIAAHRLRPGGSNRARFKRSNQEASSATKCQGNTAHMQGPAQNGHQNCNSNAPQQGGSGQGTAAASTGICNCSEPSGSSMGSPSSALALLAPAGC